MTDKFQWTEMRYRLKQKLCKFIRNINANLPFQLNTNLIDFVLYVV